MRVAFRPFRGGCRNNDGGFYNQSLGGLWWGSTEFGAADAWNRSLYYGNANLFRSGYNKRCGFSVRLVRDLN